MDEQLRAAREAALREVGGHIVSGPMHQYSSLGSEKQEPIPSPIGLVWERRWGLRAMARVARSEIDSWWFRLRNPHWPDRLGR